jgi:hypothetical protein
VVLGREEMPLVAAVNVDVVSEACPSMISELAWEPFLATWNWMEALAIVAPGGMLMSVNRMPTTWSSAKSKPERSTGPLPASSASSELVETRTWNVAGVGVAVGVGVGVRVGAEVGVVVGVAVGIVVGVTVGVGVAAGVAVGVALGVAVGVAVGVGEAVGVAVGIALGTVVGVGVKVGVAVGVAVGVEANPA